MRLCVCQHADFKKTKTKTENFVITALQLKYLNKAVHGLGKSGSDTGWCSPAPVRL